MMLKHIERLALEAFEQNIPDRAYHIKSDNQLVTQWDLAVEKHLITGLSALLPEAGFITEEKQIAQESGREWVWVIDPIDGTTNFAHHLPVYCCSIALLHFGKPHTGFIYAPALNETFTAQKGKGAFLNGKPIKVSSTLYLNESLIATGFPYYDFQFMPAYMNSLRSLMEKTQGLRRMGSAAIDLAYSACGRFDAFFEYGLNMWDVAAGIVILEEAGGMCTGFFENQNPLEGTYIIASNAAIHSQIQTEIQKYFNP